MDIADPHASLSDTAVAALDTAVGRIIGHRAVGTADVLFALLLLEARADQRMVTRSPDADHPDVVRVRETVRRSDDYWMGVPLTGPCAQALRSALAYARRTGSLPVQADLLADHGHNCGPMVVRCPLSCRPLQVTAIVSSRRCGNRTRSAPSGSLKLHDGGSVRVVRSGSTRRRDTNV